LISGRWEKYYNLPVSRLPVLIIGFVRVEGVKKLINSLVVDQISSICLAIDGPRNSLDVNPQSEIINIVRSFSDENRIPFFYWHRESNLGVAVGVVTAIDWFFSQMPAGVILEDDLVVGRDFIPFAYNALQVLENETRVLMVSGNQFIPTDDFTVLRASNYPLIWGWATTREKWAILREGLLSQQTISLRDFLSTRNSYWAIGAWRALTGTIDTWDLPLVKFMLHESHLCLLPPVNLVSNEGFDQFASHTKIDQFPLHEPIRSFNLDVLAYRVPGNLEIKEVNTSLERCVYGITWKNIFSLPVGLLKTIFRGKRDSLEKRLNHCKEIPMGNH